MSADAKRGRRATLQDVAKRAGVSIATVSLVLGGETTRSRATPQTRRRILAAASALGYERNQLARGLRRGRTEQVGVAIQNALTSWAQSLVSDVAAVAETRGYATMAVLGGQWRPLVSRGLVDGAVIDFGWERPPEFDDLRQPLERGLALVVLSNHLEPDGFDVVHANDVEACAAAMHQLVDSGRRRIACLRHSPPPPERTDTRYHIYRRVLEQRGLVVDDALRRDFFGSPETAYTEALGLLSSAERPDAIFATADTAAISALNAAHRLGIAVPDDLAIIGVGNSVEGRVSHPQLTTVGPQHLDFTSVGELLFDRLDGRVEPPGRILHQDWQLIRRGTA